MNEGILPLQKQIDIKFECQISLYVMSLRLCMSNTNIALHIAIMILKIPVSVCSRYPTTIEIAAWMKSFICMCDKKKLFFFLNESTSLPYTVSYIILH